MKKLIRWNNINYFLLFKVELGGVSLFRFLFVTVFEYSVRIGHRQCPVKVIACDTSSPVDKKQAGEHKKSPVRNRAFVRIY